MKSPDKSKELQSILKQELGGNQARLSLLSYLILSMLKVRSVNFKKLSAGYYNGASLLSRLRRVQRFFRQFRFEDMSYSRLIIRMLPVEGKYQLSLDRTNWKYGGLNINLLFLSVIHQGVGLPIFWCVLGNKRGNSSQQERIDLLTSFIRAVGKDRIDCLTADREFIGKDWVSFLERHNIRFYIRVRKNMHLTIGNGKTVKAYWLLVSQPMSTAYFHPKMVRMQDSLVYFSGMRFIGKDGKPDYLIVVCFSQNEMSMEIYRKRWQIEMMFKAFKSAGFRLEESHINDYQRLNTLIRVMAIAFIWAYNMGLYLHEKVKPIAVKKHGRKSVSIFTYGLDRLNETLINLIDSYFKIAIQLFLSCT